MNNYLIKGATLVNEQEQYKADVQIKGGVIAKIDKACALVSEEGQLVLDGTGKYLLPGAIDDQVHFREPGLTHKGEIYTEARAAVAGGVTSYMEMPNTSPSATTVELLEQKYSRASEVSLANYSFFMGTTNDNLNELLKLDPKQVCGVKIFMGSSTGNMVIDNAESLENIFAQVKMLIATHCEDDPMIKRNLAAYVEKYGEDIPVEAHPLIRSAEACYASSTYAVSLAKKHGSRLHILHISTAKELELFDGEKPLKEKKITAEACVHHLWFTDADYKTKGNFIKWNPAVKTANDRMNIREALNNGKIDVIATDHAPHTLEEKSQKYAKAPSGGPLVQHSMVAMLELVREGVLTIERMVQLMSHNVAELFQVEKRGFIREGYFADLVLVDLNSPWTVDKSNIAYKCGWSPFEGLTFHSKIEKTFVNGHMVYDNGVWDEQQKGMRLTFER
jgi:dihydroorotase